jgi:hypothetical protein
MALIGNPGTANFGVSASPYTTALKWKWKKVRSHCPRD